MHIHSQGSSPCIAFDQECTVFAAGLFSSVVRLYDIKAFENVNSFLSHALRDLLVPFL